MLASLQNRYSFTSPPRLLLFLDRTSHNSQRLNRSIMSLRRSAKTEISRNWYMVDRDDADADADADEGLEDNMVEIPKRRCVALQGRFLEEGIDNLVASMAAMQQGQDFSLSISSGKRLQSLAQIVAGVMSDDNNLQYEMTKGLRKLLTKEHNPPINEVVQSGVVPRIVQFLSRDDFPQLQLEAAWALTNVASGTTENTKVIIDSGAVPLFIKLLSSSNENVREQVVWALGNVAGHSPQYRDFVLSHGAMLSLLAQFNDNAKLSMLKTATWTLSNFCGRKKPLPAVEQTLAALPFLQHLVHSTDEEVLTDTCWALSHLSNGMNDKVQTVIDLGVIPRLIQLLAHPSPSVIIPALRTIGNIVSGDDMQTQTLLNYHPLPALLNLLTNTYKNTIKKEICWTISNITAGNRSQIQEVIQSGIIPPLMHLLQQGQFDTKKEAAWAISNATSHGNHDQIKFLVSQGCIEPLCNLLTCPVPRIVTVCLEGLENILKVGEAEKNVGDYNLYSQMIYEAEGVEKIKNLQSHDNNEIKDKAVTIFKAFWAEDGVMVCHNVGEASESNGFQFRSQNGAAAPTRGGLLSLLERLYINFRG